MCARVQDDWGASHQQKIPVSTYSDRTRLALPENLNLEAAVKPLQLYLPKPLLPCKREATTTKLLQFIVSVLWCKSGLKRVSCEFHSSLLER